MASELVRLRVDVLVTHGTPGALAAKRATATIPIVVATSADAIALGLVESLARPGGNITGPTFLVPEVKTRRLPAITGFVLRHLAATPVASAIAALSERERAALADDVRKALLMYAEGDGVRYREVANVVMAVR